MTNEDRSGIISPFKDPNLSQEITKVIEDNHAENQTSGDDKIKKISIKKIKVRATS